MSKLRKYFHVTALVLALAAAWGASALLAGEVRTVTGVIVDIYNDEVAGEALVTLKTGEGVFIIDCRHQSFPAPISPGDRVKVTVRNIRTINQKTVGDLLDVLQQNPARR